MCRDGLERHYASRRSNKIVELGPVYMVSVTRPDAFCCVSVNFGLCRACAIGTGERRNKSCQLLIDLVFLCLKVELDNASHSASLV